MRNLLLLLFFFLQSVQIFANSASKQPEVFAEFLQKQEDIPSILFHIKDFPIKEEITLSVFRPLLEETRKITSFTVDEKEKIHFRDKTKNGFIQLSEMQFFQGEKVVFSFQTKEKQLVKLPLIPHRNFIKNANGRSISAELFAIKPSFYALELDGFKNEEKFTVESETYGEVIRSELSFDTVRNITISPDVLGQSAGVTKLSIKVGNETISIDLPWGISLVGHLSEAKIKISK